MPFTFAHPAIIFPLKYFPKKWFSWTALIIGSLTPDFEYFIRMQVQSKYSHTVSGIFWFDLPLAIALTFVFHNLIRNDLFLNLPNSFKSRIIAFTEFNWTNYFNKNLFIVLLSAIIGIASHLFWDAFTHKNGYFVIHIPELRNTFILFGNKVTFWKATQHLSTLIGALFIAIAFLKLPKKHYNQSKINLKYWILILVVSTAIFSFRFLISLNIKAYGNIIVSLISSFLLSLIITPILIKSNGNYKI
ncbi:protein of unknown function [Flavobacterium resistens]|uniref:DUF4184 family protein n=1 Tax=Flavobacterium resistens TaxID=443612 RepID=A0A521EPD1_9FLAO|nr:DUF4184 family protein [Flavobacterium resistens]MRX67815.1 DUF4184 family protein [Flavobacterium resistens]SMO85752.1 protein of unknown function [Flavobacterium resistens]